MSQWVNIPLVKSRRYEVFPVTYAIYQPIQLSFTASLSCSMIIHPIGWFLIAETCHDLDQPCTSCSGVVKPLPCYAMLTHSCFNQGWARCVALSMTNVLPNSLLLSFVGSIAYIRCLSCDTYHEDSNIIGGYCTLPFGSNGTGVHWPMYLVLR